MVVRRCDAVGDMRICAGRRREFLVLESLLDRRGIAP